MNQWARKRSAENIKVDFLCQWGAKAAHTLASVFVFCLNYIQEQFPNDVRLIECNNRKYFECPYVFAAGDGNAITEPSGLF